MILFLRQFSEARAAHNVLPNISASTNAITGPCLGKKTAAGTRTKIHGPEDGYRNKHEVQPTGRRNSPLKSSWMRLLSPNMQTGEWS